MNAGVIVADDCVRILNASDLVVVVCCCCSTLSAAFLSNAAPPVSTTENETFCCSQTVTFCDFVTAGAKLYRLFYSSNRVLCGSFLFLEHCRSLTPLAAFGMPVTANFNAGLGGFKIKCGNITHRHLSFW